MKIKTNTLNLELFQLPRDIVFLLDGVSLVVTAVTTWRFRDESPGATANK